MSNAICNIALSHLSFPPFGVFYGRLGVSSQLFLLLLGSSIGGQSQDDPHCPPRIGVSFAGCKPVSPAIWDLGSPSAQAPTYLLLGLHTGVARPVWR